MPNLSMKKIALGVSFLAASLGAAPAWATDIKVAVAANFSDALTALTTAYGLAGWSYSSTSTFTVTSGATATQFSGVNNFTIVVPPPSNGQIRISGSWLALTTALPSGMNTTPLTFC